MSSSQPPRLLDQVKQVLRTKHYSLKTEKSYIHYIREFILFHGKRHPRDMGAGEIRAYLSHLAVERTVAASTQNVALSALLFLYRHVLEIDLPYIDNIERAKPSERLPEVFTRDEVKQILFHLDGVHYLIASLLYGTGLRLTEGLRLRVKDLDFEYRQITVRDGKGKKGRRTMLSDALIAIAPPIKAIAPPIKAIAPPIKAIAPQPYSITHPLKPILQTLKPLGHPLKPIPQTLKPILITLKPIALPLKPISQTLKPIALQLKPIAPPLKPNLSTLKSSHQQLHIPIPGAKISRFPLP